MQFERIDDSKAPLNDKPANSTGSPELDAKIWKYAVAWRDGDPDEQGEAYLALIADCAALVNDAARYRWLRSEEVATEPRYYPFWEEFQYKLSREGKMDALIDAWMASPSAPDVTAAVLDSPQEPLS